VSKGTWRSTRGWRHGIRSVNAPAHLDKSLGGVGASELSVTVTNGRTAEGSSSSATTTMATAGKRSDVRLEEGGYEMHALGATALALGGNDAGHGGGDDDESVGGAT